MPEVSCQDRDYPVEIVDAAGAQPKKRAKKISLRGAAVGHVDYVAAAVAFRIIAAEHGATLASTDRGFARFKKLAWVNPLVQ